MLKTIKLKKISLTKIKYNDAIIVTSLYAIMPIVDSLSGAFHDSIPIGQFYRSCVFLYILFVLGKYSRLGLKQVLIPFVIFLVAQTIVGPSYASKSIQDVIKLFTPISTVVMFEVLSVRDDKCISIFNKIMDYWSVIYPLLILIPGLLGYGINAYEGTTGFKGFFYAVNEISFIMSSIVMYLFWRLKKSPNLKNALILCINCLTVFLMGTKTGYATVGLFAVIFVLSLFNKNTKKNFLKLIVMIIGAVIVLLLNYQRLINMISSILERWFFQRQLSTSAADFLFSMRLRRLQDSVDTFLSQPYYLFTGWGFGGELSGFPNMEMDFLDLLFRTGILGFVYIVIFYGKRVLKAFRHNRFGFIVLLWSIALSFGAGHVLFYGQSGMALAVNFIWVSCSYNKSK